MATLTKNNEIFLAPSIKYPVKIKMKEPELTKGIVKDLEKIFNRPAIENLTIDDIVPDLMNIGFYSIMIDETLIGIDGNICDFTYAVSSLAWFDLGLSLSLHDHLTATYLLNQYALPEKKQLHLNHIIKFSKIFSLGIDFIANNGKPKNKMISSIQKDGSLMISGEKIVYNTNQNRTELILIQEENSQSFYFFNPAASNITVNNYENNIGLYNIKLNKLIYHNLQLDNDHKILTISPDNDYLSKLIAYYHIGIASAALGSGYKAYHLAQKYSDNRILFNQKIKYFQLIQKKLIEMEAYLFQMKAILFLAQETVLTNNHYFVEYAYLAKIFCADKAFQIVKECLQIHSANGYMNDTGIPKLFQDVKFLNLCCIQTPEFNKMILNILNEINQNSQNNRFDFINLEYNSIFQTAFDLILKHYKKYVLENKADYDDKKNICQLTTELIINQAAFYYLNHIKKDEEKSEETKNHSEKIFQYNLNIFKSRFYE